jgi:Ca-activated chloride channel homolog
MKGAVLFIGVLVTAVTLQPRPMSVAAQDPQAEQQARPMFRSSVDLVSVAAVVRDRKGRFVRDLSRDDFQVVEAGQTRQILDFRRQSDGPIKVALLFDVSGSMRLGSKAVDARQAARHLLSALNATDMAALFTFDSALRQLQGFTSDMAAVDAGMSSIERPFGQTSLYDAIAETARFAAAGSREGGRLAQRSAVVVLTDGVDTRSRLSPEEVSAVASGIDVPVYIVTVLAPIDADASQAEREGSAEQPLASLARWTGGELFTTSAPAHASVAARQIVSELRHQYVLAFEASARPGWRPLEIRARDRDLRVKARSGYTAGFGRASEETPGNPEGIGY